LYFYGPNAPPSAQPTFEAEMYVFSCEYIAVDVALQKQQFSLPDMAYRRAVCCADVTLVRLLLSSPLVDQLSQNVLIFTGFSG